MTGKEIQKLFGRLARLVEATQQKSGDGTAWDYTFPNGETRRYIFRNIKSPEKIEDSVYSLLIWIWIAKDYLKLLAETKGRNPNQTERVCSDDPHLNVCADLANRIKHGRLNRSRSGKFAKLGEVRFTVPQSAVRSITFRVFEVEVDIAQASGVEFQIPIIDAAGKEIGDAFEYASAAISRLESLRDGTELAK